MIIGREGPVVGHKRGANGLVALLKGRAARLARPRFTLSMLLLLTTAVALWAAYLGSDMRREHRLRAWYADVERRGGSVRAFTFGEVSINFRGVPLTDDDFTKLQLVRSDNCGLHLTGCELSDQRLLTLASVSGLRDISFDAEDVSLVAVQEFERRAPDCAVHTRRAALR